jgi:uncharacterized membrane protein
MNPTMPMIGPLQDSVLFQDIVIYFYILWTLCKFLFYILPIVDLIKIKNYDGKRTDIAISYMIVITVFEFVAYYYVVTRIIEKILADERGRRASGILSCQIYGIAAGILNTILVIMSFMLTNSANSHYMGGDIWAMFLLNMIIFSSWLYLSYLHLRGVFMARRLLLANRTAA